MANDKRVDELAAKIHTLEEVTKELHTRIEGVIEVNDQLMSQMNGMEEVIARLDATVSALTERVAVLEEPKARGPKTDRPMTEADAYRAKFGDLKALNHKEAAAALNLSYGQVFSCRGGYTFKHVKPNSRNDDGTELVKVEGA